MKGLNTSEKVYLYSSLSNRDTSVEVLLLLLLLLLIASLLFFPRAPAASLGATPRTRLLVGARGFFVPLTCASNPNPSVDPGSS